MEKELERIKVVIGVITDLSQNGCKVNGKFYKFSKYPDSNCDFNLLKEKNIYKVKILDNTYIVNYELLHSNETENGMNNNINNHKEVNKDTMLIVEDFLKKKHDENLSYSLLYIEKENKKYSPQLIEKSIKHAIDLLDLIIKYHSKKDNNAEIYNLADSIKIGLNGEILFMENINFNMLVLSFIKIYERYADSI